jgi:branched-chain amino acid transport system permease protein
VCGDEFNFVSAPAPILAFPQREKGQETMTDFLQLFFSGLATGSIYALAALGFTLLWQASGTINFAQGEFVMLPAFMLLGFMAIGAPLLVSFVLTILLAVLLLGYVFKRGLVDPLFKYGMMPIVVATIGLSIALRNGVRAGYSAEAHPFPSLFADKIFNIAGVTITMQDIGTFALAMVIVLATQAFLAKTVTGRAMQAVAQNTESASVLGINVPRMIFYTFAINAVLAVAAALLVTPTYLAKFDMGEGLGTKAFFAAIIGGFNNSRGALLGGLIVGVCENLAAAYISPAYKDAVALIIFMVVILFKPQGLLGKKEERKV